MQTLKITVSARVFNQLTKLAATEGLTPSEYLDHLFFPERHPLSAGYQANPVYRDALRTLQQTMDFKALPQHWQFYAIKDITHIMDHLDATPAQITHHLAAAAQTLTEYYGYEVQRKDNKPNEYFLPPLNPEEEDIIED